MKAASHWWSWLGPSAADCRSWGSQSWCQPVCGWGLYCGGWLQMMECLGLVSSHLWVGINSLVWLLWGSGPWTWCQPVGGEGQIPGLLDVGPGVLGLVLGCW